METEKCVEPPAVKRSTPPGPPRPKNFRAKSDRVAGPSGAVLGASQKPLSLPLEVTFAARGGALVALSAVDLSFWGDVWGVHFRVPVLPAGEVLSPTSEIFLPTDVDARYGKDIWYFSGGGDKC